MKDAYGYVGDKARKASDYLPVIKGPAHQALLFDFILRQKKSHWMNKGVKKTDLGFRRSLYSMKGEPLRNKANRGLLEAPTLVQMEINQNLTKQW